MAAIYAVILYSPRFHYSIRKMFELCHCLYRALLRYPEKPVKLYILIQASHQPMFLSDAALDYLSINFHMIYLYKFSEAMISKSQICKKWDVTQYVFLREQRQCHTTCLIRKPVLANVTFLYSAIASAKNTLILFLK